MAGKKRLAILISGRGSNMVAIARAVKRGKIPQAEIAVVISNKPDAPGLKKAQRMGLETLCISHKDFPTREDFDRRIGEELKKRKVDLVCLAGFMRILSPYFVNQYRNRIMNIHPALLPSFPGMQAQKDALEHGVKYTGCTVHFVSEDVDAGPIIIQKVVPVRDDDDAETLSARILKQEHKIYAEAVRLFTEDRLEVRGRRVFWRKEP
ncbi:phosphoribosylglycinamide formyltransferase [bacterium (candidate division B38) B3_B38]|nr:MAG: phosphoribosylglycinamide formyltransferase [bacterium (candidate division B38) B3_B38]